MSNLEERPFKPKWQRARIINMLEDSTLNGRELWIEVGPPRELDEDTIASLYLADEDCIRGKYFRTNLLATTNPTEVSWIADDIIELLPDFASADEVLMLPYSVWLKETEPTHA